MKKLPIFNYKISNQSGERLDVFIDGDIVDAETQEIYREWFNDQTSVSFKSFRSEILSSGIKNISITINSRGGQIFDAMAMHDFIQQLEGEGYNIETIGIGMVCSAATFILSASKKSKISSNAYYMIHNVSGGVWGDVNEVEKYSTQLRNFNNNLRDFYVSLTGKTAEEIQALMDAETWFYGKEAVENGFVKNTISIQNPTNAINQSDWTFKNMAPMNVYNSFVNTPSENDDNLIQTLNMNKFVEAIVNAFKSNNLVVTDENKTTEPLTVENLTSALTTALEGVQTEPSEESIQNAVSNFFKNGLPENVVNQITKAVQPAEQTPFNLSEDEDYKDLTKRVEEVENKILNGVGPSKAPKNENEKKYEGVEFS